MLDPLRDIMRDMPRECRSFGRSTFANSLHSVEYWEGLSELSFRKAFLNFQLGSKSL